MCQRKRSGERMKFEELSVSQKVFYTNVPEPFAVEIVSLQPDRDGAIEVKWAQHEPLKSLILWTHPSNLAKETR